MWGSAYLLISIGLESFGPGAVTALRILFGLGVLALVPGARRTPVARGDWPRVALLGVLWLAVPLTLFPIAQQWIDSSVAGMVTGAQPLLTAGLAAFLLRRRPGPRQLGGLAVGFVGIVAITVASATGSGAGPSSPAGVALVLVAVACYAVAANLAVPLQQRYGGLAVILRALLVALVLVAPFGLWSLAVAGRGTPSLASVAAVVVLGVSATGLGYVAFTTLVGRAGATRGASAVYGIPVLAIVLGLVVGHDPVRPLALAGSVLVLVGAYLTSRRET